MLMNGGQLHALYLDWKICAFNPNTP